MKSYKNFEKRSIGSSDIASLTVRSGMKVAPLNFGEDGSYSAYIVTEEAEIGSHYKLTFEGKGWVTIFDDTRLTFEARADEIKIYQAGAFGCIIQLLGNPRIKPLTAAQEV